MLLRSGRKLKIQKILKAHKERKAAKNMNTTPDAAGTPTGTPQPSVSFQVINTRTSLVPFAGKIQGVLQQNLESFLHAVDDLLAAKRLTDDHIVLAEAKSYLDLTKGDLGAWSRSLAYTKCRTWGEMKTFLRSVYGLQKDQDAVLQLRELFKLADRKGRSLVANNALTNDLLSDLRLTLETSSWVNSTDHTIKLDNLVTLLQLSCMTANLPDNLVANFDIDFDENSNETDVYKQVQKHSKKVTNLDTSIFLGKGLNEKPATAAAVKEPPTAVAATRYNSSGPTSHKGECLNCRRPGHIAKFCRSLYCYIHKTNRHALQDCSKNPFKFVRSEDNRENPKANSSTSQSQSRSVRPKQSPNMGAEGFDPAPRYQKNQAQTQGRNWNRSDSQGKNFQGTKERKGPR